jgi:hypothetical protein
LCPSSVLIVHRVAQYRLWQQADGGSQVAEPIVFISRFRLRAGAADAFESAFGVAIELIAETKPRTASYAAYVDDARLQLSVVHVFPDAEAMSSHFIGSDQRTGSIADLAEPAGFEVFGPAPASAVDQLRREASEAGVELSVCPRSLGGFLRAPA